MFKAALAGAGITLVLIIVPLVHFVTAIPSPFIGGYFAGVKAGPTPGEALTLGGVMALLLTAPVAGILFAISAAWLDLSGVAMLGIIVVIFVYIAALGGIGAMVGGAHRRRNTPESEGAPE
ncbi:MAG: hypothetical protein WD533_04395 [Dehalococcoidia bacterium]